MLKLLQNFQKMDRRWVFLGMALTIVIPLLFPFKLPFKVEKEVTALYDQVESLQEGTPVLVSADFDPGSMPELWPFFTSNLHHMFAKDLKPVFVTLWPTASPLIIPEINKIAKFHGKEYGEDYAFLGYKEGRELVIKNIGQNFRQAFPKDYRGTALDEIPVLDGLKQAKDFPLLISISAGFPGLNEYVLQIQGQYNLNMIGACTAVSGPDYLPFLKSGQIQGLSMGIPGSAQYEKLVVQNYGDKLPNENNIPEGQQIEPFVSMGAQGLNVLSLSHLFIILLILLGNVAYFITKRVEDS